MEWIIQAPVLFFSIIFHEFAHGYTAYRHGDDTAYLSGRLTFNPLAHIDIFGTILLPALCYISHLPMFGWAKPVPVNPLRLVDMRRSMVKVALSGPASNLTLVAALAVLYKALLAWLPATGFMLLLFKAMQFGIIINLTLAFFNLIPVAPLDGSQVLGGLLRGRWAEMYARHARYGMWILLGLMVTGLIKWLIIPPLYASIVLLAKMGVPLMPL